LALSVRREETKSRGKCSRSERRQALGPESATGCYPVIAHDHLTAMESQFERVLRMVCPIHQRRSPRLYAHARRTIAALCPQAISGTLPMPSAIIKGSTTNSHPPKNRRWESRRPGEAMRVPRWVTKLLLQRCSVTRRYYATVQGRLHKLTHTRKHDSFATQEEPRGLFGLKAMIVGYNLRYTTCSIEQA
jgi:hypothetical protein